MAENNDSNEEIKSATYVIEKQMKEEDKKCLMMKDATKIKDTVLVNASNTQTSTDISREDILTLQKNMNQQFSKFEEKYSSRLATVVKKLKDYARTLKIWKHTHIRIYLI